MDNNDIVILLTSCISLNEQERIPATKRVNTLLSNPEFQKALVNVFQCFEFSNEIRLQAVILFRNSIRRHWNCPELFKHKQQQQQQQQQHACLNIDDKNKIKLLLWNLLTTEPTTAIAKQISVSIAKIARLDFPEKWPNLFPTALSFIQSEQLVDRGLYVLNEILEELASKRLLIDRRNFQKASTSLISFIKQQWCLYMNQIMNTLSNTDTNNNTADINALLQRVLLISKCLRYLVVFGIARPDESPETQELFPLVIQCLNTLYNLRKQLQTDSDVEELLSELMIVIANMIIEVQFDHPLPFIVYLEKFTSFFINIIRQTPHDSCVLIFPQFAACALKFISRILKCTSYDPQLACASFSMANGVEIVQNGAEVSHNIIQGIFSPNIIQELLQLLVTRFLVMKQDDLNLWNNDPDYFIQRANTADNTELISIVADVIDTIITKFDTISCTIIISMLDHITNTQQQQQGQQQSLDDILLQEAVYHTIGLNTTMMLQPAFEETQYAMMNWYQQSLYPILCTKEPLLRILRHRIIWLLGEWVDAVPVELRPSIYESISTLLQENDPVIRYAASICLRRMVDDVNYNDTREHIVPYLEGIFQHICELIIQSQDLDTRSQLMNVISITIELTNTMLGPALPVLGQFLPQIWQESENMNVLRSTILSALTHLVTSVMTESVHLHTFILPVLQFSLDSQAKDRSYLLECGIDLWLALIRNAPNHGTTDMLSLFQQYWYGIVMEWREHLTSCGHVLESYVLLMGSQFLQQEAQNICACMLQLYPQLSGKGVLALISPLHLIFRLYPHEAPDVFASILKCILNDLLQQKYIQQKINPSYRNDTFYSAGLSLYARILFASQDTFTVLMNKTFSNNNNTNVLIVQLVDLYFEKQDVFIIPHDKKLCALALCNCLLINDVNILKRLSLIIDFCTNSLLDDDGGGDVGNFLSQFADAKNVPLSLQTETQRRQIMISEDTAVSTNLRDYLRNNMSRCADMIGAQAWQELSNTVDAFFWQSLEAAVSKNNNNK